MLRIRHYLLVFQAVTSTTMVVTAPLATPGTGGVLQRAIQAMLGPATWDTAVGTQAQATALGKTGCLLGVSGTREVIIYEL